MKPMLALALCLMLCASAYPQKKAATKESSSPSLAATVEAKVHKSWEDYKNRNKQSFAASLAPGFSEVTDGADGIFGKDTELSEMDHFTLTHYELNNFKVRPLGSTTALITYSAKYDGSYDNSPINMKTVYADIWVKSGADWKLLWEQETKVK
jgi:hypothetical protein